MYVFLYNISTCFQKNNIVYIFFTVTNKQVLIQYGVLEAVMTLTSSEVMAVIFKLLGVLRMLIDGQGIYL
jgi:hypothetical protein